MNEKQVMLYFYRWNPARKALRIQGSDCAECERLRKQIHLKRGAYFVVNGVMKIKSHTRLTNKELDMVLADFDAIAKSNDLESQLEQLNMPEKRILHACAKLFDAIGIDEDGRARYAEGIVKKPLMDCDARDEQRIIIALSHTAMHKAGKPHSHPRSGKGRERHDHRVGARAQNPIEDPAKPSERSAGRTPQPTQHEEELEDAPF